MSADIAAESVESSPLLSRLAELFSGGLPDGVAASSARDVSGTPHLISVLVCRKSARCANVLQDRFEPLIPQISEKLSQKSDPPQ